MDPAVSDKVTLGILSALAGSPLAVLIWRFVGGLLKREEARLSSDTARLASEVKELRTETRSEFAGLRQLFSENHSDTRELKARLVVCEAEVVRLRQRVDEAVEELLNRTSPGLRRAAAEEK